MASQDITISTVAIGPSADQKLATLIARRGKGRFHAIADHELDKLGQLLRDDMVGASTQFRIWALRLDSRH